MKFGFHKVDITPRVGVELQGYGPFLNRHSDGIRDSLFARAMAVDDDAGQAVIVSCDLAGVSKSITRTVRELVHADTGIDPEHVMVHAIHTHSGPALRMYAGWGTPDPTYLEILPRRIAQACVHALRNLTEATIHHAETACEGIAINREYDAFQAESVQDALQDDWRPSKPELTDTTCRMFKILAGDRLIGFLSYYGCHPVIGGAGTRKIHGDYAGIATNIVEQMNPGAVGLFLQGAQGDINACVVCHEETDAMRALNVIAGRYARAVMRGLETATPIDAGDIKIAQRHVAFSRKNWDRETISDRLANEEKILHAPDASDSENDVRMAMVKAIAYRSIIAKMDNGESPVPETTLHGLRIGPVSLLGTPFEVFRNIKNDIVSAATSPIPLVMGFTNDSIGYAVDKTTAAKGGYAADLVPLICGQLPFANIHDELVDAVLALDADLNA